MPFTKSFTFSALERISPTHVAVFGVAIATEKSEYEDKALRLMQQQVDSNNAIVEEMKTIREAAKKGEFKFSAEDLNINLSVENGLEVKHNLPKTPSVKDSAQGMGYQWIDEKGSNFSNR